MVVGGVRGQEIPEIVYGVYLGNEGVEFSGILDQVGDERFIIVVGIRKS